ncbi:hypothetical protein A2U01_0041966, partial [Trifolium medium]|nr:hypothetical protein [Trifolium medium]
SMLNLTCGCDYVDIVDGTPREIGNRKVKRA